MGRSLPGSVGRAETEKSTCVRLRIVPSSNIYLACAGYSVVEIGKFDRNSRGFQLDSVGSGIILQERLSAVLWELTFLVHYEPPYEAARPNGCRGAVVSARSMRWIVVS